MQEQRKKCTEEVDRVIFLKIESFDGIAQELHNQDLPKANTQEGVAFHRHSCFKTNQGRTLIYYCITKARLKVMKESNKGKENHKQD